MKKKIINLVLLLVLLITITSVFTTVKGSTKPLIVEGRTIKYADGTTVMVNSEYVYKDTEFRAVWVSPLTGDIAGFTNEEQYKKQMINVFDTMEYYNLNVLLFHVRIMNDALYESSINKWSSYYNENPSWDALPWIIEECHKRGIEFHAWMNPYRVTTSVNKSLETIASEFPKNNPASRPENLLKGSSVVILNPGIETVRSFLVNTCMELIRKYDIDAIHFDDYFYQSGINDSQTMNANNPKGLSVDNWRREQINAFIKSLSQSMKQYNIANNRCVQLGISPTGVYRNGDGSVTYTGNIPITNGSATRGYAHYGSPLYADTLNWINNEWIDYILPQTYHAITNYSAPYCDLVNWWNKVMKYSRVNLYSSIGLYMQGDSGNASWNTNEYEGYQQILFSNTMENVQGSSVYNYLALLSSKRGTSFKLANTVWDKPIILPEIETYDPIILDQVENLKVTKTPGGNNISFSKMDNAKFYVIYKSTKPLTFSADEVLDVIGNVTINDVVNYVDQDASNNVKYYYGVRPQSNSLTLGATNEINTDDMSTDGKISLGEIEGFGVTDNLAEGETVTVFWKEKYYPFGNAMNYKLIYDFDGNQIESKVITQDKGRLTNSVYIPMGTKEFKVKLICENDIGISEETLTKSVFKALPKLTTFEYLNTPYRNEDVTFIWNNLQDESIKYVVQASLDSFTWMDIETETSPYASSNNFCKTDIKSLDEEIIYYRLKAYTDSAVSYSESKKIIQINYLGDFSPITINNKPVISDFTFDEEEIISIKWKKNTSTAIYTVMVSTDLKTWFSVRTYDYTSKSTVTNDYITQTITLNGNEFAFYIKITGSDNSDGISSNESKIIKINVNLQMLFPDLLAMYNNNELGIFIDNMNIFND